MAKIDNYPNIKNVVELLQEERQINIFLGIEVIDNRKIFHHITAMRRGERKYTFTGIFKGRYFLYDIYVDEDGELINTRQCYEPMFISINNDE